MLGPGANGHRRPDLLPDDPDALELLRHQAERRRAAGSPTALASYRANRAVEPADQEVGAAVAVEIAELGNVLAVGEDRRAVGVLQRVGGEHEPVGAPRAVVAIVLDVAERLLGEEVEIAVGVHVGEAIPLAHVEPAVLRRVRNRNRGRPSGLAVALVERDAAGHFLHEEIEVAVAVGVHQLGARGVEAADEGQLQRRGRRCRPPGKGETTGRNAGPRAGGSGARVRRPRRTPPRSAAEEERAERERQRQGLGRPRCRAAPGVIPRPAA